MNKDLHDIDDLFRSALDGHEETPSTRVKENIDVALDKQDAEEYKKKFILWKRATLLLLLLVAGSVLYESVKIAKLEDKTETANPTNNTSVN